MKKIKFVYMPRGADFHFPEKFFPTKGLSVNGRTDYDGEITRGPSERIWDIVVFFEDASCAPEEKRLALKTEAQASTS